MTTEPIEGEVVAREQNGAAMLPAVRSVGLPVLKSKADVEAFVQQALLQWEAYQKLTKDLLDESDYQKIGNRKFKKKSAWRKYARAFNISCEKLSEEVVRAPDAWPVFARVVVRASTPDGRFQDGDQECHITERCCAQPCPKRNWSNHYCCQKECDGRKHFSHPGDLPATAFTRAKNRAISDLIGAGEVSFEEMKDEPSQDEEPKPAKRPAKTAATKKAGLPTFDAKYDRECAKCGLPIMKGNMYAFDKDAPAVYHAGDCPTPTATTPAQEGEPA